MCCSAVQALVERLSSIARGAYLGVCMIWCYSCPDQAKRRGQAVLQSSQHQMHLVGSYQHLKPKIRVLAEAELLAPFAKVITCVTRTRILAHQQVYPDVTKKLEKLHVRGNVLWVSHQSLPGFYATAEAAHAGLPSPCQLCRSQQARCRPHTRSIAWMQQLRILECF